MCRPEQRGEGSGRLPLLAVRFEEHLLLDQREDARITLLSHRPDQEPANRGGAERGSLQISV